MVNDFLKRVNQASATFLVSVLPLLIRPDISRGEPKPPALDSGMDYSAVIKAWGAPSDREEHESARNDIWIYNFGRVAFHEGRVTSWSLDKAPVLEPAARPASPPAAAESKSASGDPQLVEEILAEIMKEAPQSDDKPVAGAPPPPPAVSMPNPAPMPAP